MKNSTYRRRSQMVSTAKKSQATIPAACWRRNVRQAVVPRRHLTFRPRHQYEAQRQLRAEQATDAWRDRYAHRSGIEGTIAQASRRSDLHQARYRGLAKTHLQHVLTALALNLVRIDAWLTGTPLGGSWASRLTRLRPALSPT
jgi:IS5 family transposase